MAKMPCIVDDVLGALCTVYGIGGCTLLDGHYVFDSEESYSTAQEDLSNLFLSWLEDDDEDNDSLAEENYAIANGSAFTVMYWSTEARKWY